MKLVKSTTLLNGIKVQIFKDREYYKVMSSNNSYPKVVGDLETANKVFERRISLLSRFVCSQVDC